MKYCLILLLCLSMVGCTQKDSLYYWQHPKQLKQAKADCPRKKPSGVSCDEITVIATKFKYLSSELKQNPQIFGQHIIALQQNIASLEKELRHKKDEALTAKLNQQKKNLSEYLAVVSYYESPKGAESEDLGQ